MKKEAKITILKGFRMKKVLLALLLLIIVLMMVGCSTTAKPSETKSTYEVVEVENVSISISDFTPTGGKLIIKDTNEPPYTYGSFYILETQKDGEWYELQTKIKNYGFTDIGYLPNENGEVIFNLNWKELYGELPRGTYRILKQVNQQYISTTTFGWGISATP